MRIKIAAAVLMLSMACGAGAGNPSTPAVGCAPLAGSTYLALFDRETPSCFFDYFPESPIMFRPDGGAGTKDVWTCGYTQEDCTVALSCSKGNLYDSRVDTLNLQVALYSAHGFEGEATYSREASPSAPRCVETVRVSGIR